jgi:hypothetical protein
MVKKLRFPVVMIVTTLVVAPGCVSPFKVSGEAAVSNPAPANGQSVSLDGVSVHFLREESLPTLVSMRGATRLDALALDEFAVGSFVRKLESFRVEETQYLFVDFFKGYSGMGSQRSCTEALVVEVSAAGMLRIKDRLQYECESTADATGFMGEPPSFTKPFVLDRATARLILTDEQ